MKAAREGRLDTGPGSHTPQTAMNLAEELAALRRQVRQQEKESRRLKEELLFKQPKGIPIPGERTVYRIMKEIGLSHHPKRKPNGITKADREARKSDDLLKRDFRSAEPLKK